MKVKYTEEIFWMFHGQATFAKHCRKQVFLPANEPVPETEMNG